MKKLLASTLIIIALLIIFDFVIYLLIFHSGEKQWPYMADFIIKSLLIFVLIMNVLYNRVFSLKSRWPVFLLYLVLFFTLSMIIADRLVAINKYYYYSKTLKKNTTGDIYRVDDSLSYIGRPLVSGSYNYYIGDTITGSVPVFFDSLGFRNAPDALTLISDTTDLYLGCSFTFGDFVEAQNTYAYLTSVQLHHNYINAAISGYGSGQMLQIAKKLLPKRKFRFVFIQLSSWIAPRAMDLNGPTRFGYRPYPYFSEDSGTFRLNPPAYSTWKFSGKNWRNGDKSYPEKLLFTVTDGIKIELYDYYNSKFAQLKMDLGLLPKPTTNQKDLEIYFYNTLIDYCRENSAIPVVLKLMYPDNECKQLVDLLRKKALVIDLDSALQAVIMQKGQSYKQLYRIKHVCRNDSIVYDQHPNKFAHAIISQSIIYNLTNK